MYTRTRIHVHSAYCVWKCTVIFSWILNTGPHSCIWGGGSNSLAPALALRVQSVSVYSTSLSDNLLTSLNLKKQQQQKAVFKTVYWQNNTNRINVSYVCLNYIQCMNIYNNDKEPHINEIRRLHYKTKQRMSLLAERKKYYIYCYHESTVTVRHSQGPP